MTSEELQFYLSSYDEYRLNNSDQFVCPICKRITKSRMSYAQHLKKEHYNKENGIKNSGGYNGHYTDRKWLDKIRESTIKNNTIRFGEKIEHKVICSNCHKEFIVKMTKIKFKRHSKFFCSRKCANTRHHTPETKQKISNTLKIENKCLCNKADLNELERRQHYSNLGLNKRFTSKNELIIRDFIIKNHPDDQWTFGAGLFIDGHLISRDLYSKKLKINFEYDGIWHFKDIHGQLANKQMKDKQLEEWTINNGWKLLRISETWFKSIQNDPSKVESILYMPNWVENIIKLGIEYQK